ncbi:unnamed protein product [Urochloa humidicola]
MKRQTAHAPSRIPITAVDKPKNQFEAADEGLDDALRQSKRELGASPAGGNIASEPGRARAPGGGRACGGSAGWCEDAAAPASGLVVSN